MMMTADVGISWRGARRLGHRISAQDTPQWKQICEIMPNLAGYFALGGTVVSPQIWAGTFV
jgi:hypothetical protein